MKTTFYLSLWLLTSFFRVKSLQVIKEKFFNWQLLFTSMFVCIHAAKQLHMNQKLYRNSSTLYWLYMETRLHCIDYIWKLVYIVLIIYGNSSTLYWLYMFLFFEILVWKLPHYNDYLCICCRINVKIKYSENHFCPFIKIKSLHVRFFPHHNFPNPSSPVAVYNLQSIDFPNY